MTLKLKLALTNMYAVKLAVVIASLFLSAHAAQVSEQFKVTVTLLPAGGSALPKSAFCRTTPALAFGALVTVVCATGEVVEITAPSRGFQWSPVHGGAYRFILPSSYAAELPYFYDGFAGYGTVARWRMIQLADRDYYELLVAW